MSIEATLAEKGITLPDAPAPAANYVPFVKSGNLIFVSGQISADENGLIKGKLGDGMSVEDGAAAIGDLDGVKRVVKLTGFVNSTSDFTDQPKVINGCSDLMVEVFGDAGRHARAAVSAPSLPLGVAVEIEAIFEVA